MDEKEKIKEIEEICDEFNGELNVLQCEKNALMDEFMFDLEKNKMDELRNNLQ
jgi:hypothetical protein